MAKTYFPDNDADRSLLARVRPPTWMNAIPADRYHLAVLGAGTAGLVSAAIAAGLGARVALIERNRMGGDCLNVGCVPSKAILHSARMIVQARKASEQLMRTPLSIEPDFAAVMNRMRALRARLGENDSADRFQDMGVDVFFGDGRFQSADAMEVDGRVIRFARAIVATGTRPAPLSVTGVAEVPFLTNENVFDLTELPKRLLVIGGGPVGCELAQAFAAFGSRVTLIEQGSRILPREDPDASAIIAKSLRAAGVEVFENASVTGMDREESGCQVQWESGPSRHRHAFDRILVATGRLPNTEGLGLEAAGVEFDASGVKVNDYLRTTNRRIFAAGDVATRFRFTHAADALARLAVRNALFRGRQRASRLVIPRCTYTSPAVAHVSRPGEVGPVSDRRTFDFPWSRLDRAVLDESEEGFVRIHAPKDSDRIVSATIVGENAGELISEIAVAMSANLGLSSLSSVIHPYPTYAEAIKRCGDAYQRTRLTPRLASLLRWWLRWNR